MLEEAWVQYHKKLEFLQLPPGTHIKAAASGVDHHALYFSPQKVIHYTCDGTEGNGKCIIKECSFEEFCRAYPFLHVVWHPDSEEQGKVIEQTARNRLGEDQYDMFLNNCEDFVCVRASALLLAVTVIGLRLKKQFKTLSLVPTRG
ncbi:unnamed protein product [Symbiodinium sp. CCMP2456]|nr:unnamed protein product [Symbiodinium sp. CCMP2456]